MNGLSVVTDNPQESMEKRIIVCLYWKEIVDVVCVMLDGRE